MYQIKYCDEGDLIKVGLRLFTISFDISVWRIFHWRLFCHKRNRSNGNSIPHVHKCKQSSLWLLLSGWFGYQACESKSTSLPELVQTQVPSYKNLWWKSSANSRKELCHCGLGMEKILTLRVIIFKMRTVNTPTYGWYQ